MDEIFNKASKIEIIYPQGLDAEQISFFMKEEYKPDTDIDEDYPEIIKDLEFIFSTSADNLGELLKERIDQVERLMKILPQIEEYLTSHDPVFTHISFEID